MQIEIVYALSEKQELITLEVEPGSTVGEAIEQSGLLVAGSLSCTALSFAEGSKGSELEGPFDKLRDLESRNKGSLSLSKGDGTELQVGIFSQKCSLDHVLEPGDRIEIYRPLLIDPKERRRQRMTK